jgi:flagellar hook-associated protein 2
VYADDGTGDTLTIAESLSGQSIDVQLDNGDTIDSIVNKLNSAFTTNKVALTASRSGNDLVITGSQYGTNASFTVSYAAGGTDGTAQLGLAAGTYTGTDVAGTIGGLAATGQGQILTGVSGGITDGLGILYAGTTTGNQGSIDFVLGMSGILFNAADLIAAADGSVATTKDTLSVRINELQARADTVQQALDRRRDALVKQFVAMEAALSRLQQQSTTLNSFIASLNAAANSN